MQFLIFFVAFYPCILNIYGRLVRCNVSTDPLTNGTSTACIAYLCHMCLYGQDCIHVSAMDVSRDVRILRFCTCRILHRMGHHA